MRSPNARSLLAETFNQILRLILFCANWNTWELALIGFTILVIDKGIGHLTLPIGICSICYCFRVIARFVINHVILIHENGFQHTEIHKN